MTDMKEALAQASALGVQAGSNAAEWFLQGVGTAAMTSLVSGLDIGDPEIYDRLPYPDLSGQWADGPTPNSLAYECGVDIDDSESIDRLCNEYELGFLTGCEDKVREIAAYHLAYDPIDEQKHRYYEEN